MKTKLEAFTDTRDELMAVAENERNHLLDRVDAYLELAQLFANDRNKNAYYIREARDLIAKDL